LRSPETGSKNRGYRGLTRQQRPDVRHLNARKSPQIAGYSSETWKKPVRIGVRGGGRSRNANRSQHPNSQITGKILGIPKCFDLKSASQRVIGEKHQRFASKFPAHKNWELTHHKKANEMIELGIAFWANRDEPRWGARAQFTRISTTCRAWSVTQPERQAIPHPTNPGGTGLSLSLRLSS
jgi:hypothetical protein